MKFIRCWWMDLRLLWMSGPCEDLCGEPSCSFRETTGRLKCDDHGDYCITTMGFHVGCGKNNFTFFFYFFY